MKKISFLLALVAVVGFVSAQNRMSDLNVQTVMNHRVKNLEKSFQAPQNAQYYLVARTSSDQYERKTFFYDYREHVVAVRDSAGSDKIIDSLFYDERNNVIQVRTYQWLNGVWKYVCYVNYGYDMDNNVVERTNFNSYGTETFEQGGVYDYYYSNGRIVNHNAYFGDHQTLFETCDYFYDAQGRLEKQLYMQGFGSLDSSVKMIYTYNAQGRPALNYTYYYEGDGSWYLFESEEFIYDDAGNCIDHSVRDGGGDYKERYLYEYDLSIPASVVHMPYYIPEMIHPEDLGENNLRAIEHWYTLDANYVLQYVCDYRYEYDSYPISVEDFETSEVSVYPNPASTVVTIRNERMEQGSASVYDIYGRLCQTVELTGNVTVVNVADLPAGIYLLKMNYADGRVASRKFVKE